MTEMFEENFRKRLPIYVPMMHSLAKAQHYPLTDAERDVIADVLDLLRELDDDLNLGSNIRFGHQAFSSLAELAPRVRAVQNRLDTLQDAMDRSSAATGEEA